MAGKSLKAGYDSYRRQLHRLVSDQIRLVRLKVAVHKRVGRIDARTAKRALRYCNELLHALTVVAQVQGSEDANTVRRARDEQVRASGQELLSPYAHTAKRARAVARIKATEHYTAEQKAALVIGEQAARNRVKLRERSAARRQSRNGDHTQA